MGFEALVTINAEFDCSQSQIEFDQILAYEKWTKLPKMNKVWKVMFIKGITVYQAKSILLSDLRKAVQSVDVKHIDYAFQIGEKPIRQDRMR